MTSLPQKLLEIQNKKLSTFGKIRIFDTTLRDGDQSFGNNLLPEEKRAVACALVDFGVDIIELGFGASRSDNGMEDIIACVMRNFSEEKLPIFASLARLTQGDIDEAYESLKFAPKSKRRIHVFTSGSDNHIMAKFGPKMQFTSKEEGRAFILAETEKWVTYAVQKDVEEVEYSMEDAPAADPEFVLALVRKAIQSGAKILNIPDTVGRSTYEYMKQLFTYLREGISDLGEYGVDFYLSSHAHNDLANALETSLGAIDGGALQVEGTINGVGERYGNLNLCNFIGRIAEMYEPGILHVDVSKLHQVSELLYRILDNRALEARPFVDPVRHGAGVHTDGVRKGKKSLGIDIYSPYKESYGTRSFRPVFSPRGGSGDILSILASFGIQGYEKTDQIIQEVTAICARESVLSRWLESVNVLAIWLEHRGDFSFSEKDFIITKNSISLQFSFLGKEIRLFRAITDPSQGYIHALVEAINDYVGKKEIDVLSQGSEARSPVANHLHLMGYHFEGFKEEGLEGGQIGIATYELSYESSGESYFSRATSTNMNFAIVKSILIGSLPALIDFFKDK